ncbi:hypothetical protein [Pseudomonas bijieensis]|uniref:Uncharacterized protein n=1 Tax=Pseudomonas bijieensis TaxID=2681983 RepID=A0A6N1C5D8_9PSED|nr:hypothetical protein [Pseudomonas bijieensis]QKS80568.1 hypothetical protein GN234_00805 [Pseudomonas bijieensis]
MKNILFLILYLGGGVGLYRWVDFLRPVGEGLNGFYSWVWLDSGSELAIRQFLSFSYASFFYLVWMAIFPEPAKSYVYTVVGSKVVSSFLRSMALFVSCLLILGLVGVGLVKRPYSAFHQYFSLLVTCVLLGGWTIYLKDFFLTAANYMGRKYK